MNTKVTNTIGKGMIILTLFLWATWGATAQQPKTDPKPIALSAEASVQWAEAQRQINELQQKIDNLHLQQQLLAAKAGVPDGYGVGYMDSEKRIVYVPPPKPEAAQTKKP